MYPSKILESSLKSSTKIQMELKRPSTKEKMVCITTDWFQDDDSRRSIKRERVSGHQNTRQISKVQVRNSSPGSCARQGNLRRCPFGWEPFLLQPHIGGQPSEAFRQKITYLTDDDLGAKASHDTKREARALAAVNFILTQVKSKKCGAM